jgi:chromosome segregation ATPase
VEHIRALVRSSVEDVDAAFGVLSAEDGGAASEGGVGFPPNVEAMRRVLAAQEAYIDEMKKRERENLVEIEKLNTSLERKSRFLTELKMSHQALHVSTMAELDRVRGGKEDRARVRAVVDKLEIEVEGLKQREQELKQQSNHVRARLKPAAKVFSALTGRLSALNERVAETEAELARLEAVESERGDLDVRAAQAASALAETRARTKEAQGELESAQGELESAQGELESAQWELESARGALESARGARHEAEQRAAEAEQRTSDAEARRTSAEAACATLHDMCAVLHDKCGAADESRLCLERGLARIREGVAEVERRRHAAEADLNGRIAELAKMLRKGGVFKQKIASARSHLVSLYRELADVESDIAATRRALHVKGERAMHALVAAM